MQASGEVLAAHQLPGMVLQAALAEANASEEAALAELLDASTARVTPSVVHQLL